MKKLFIAMLLAVSVAAKALTLEWDPPADVTITGYAVYIGTASRNYIWRIDAGDVKSIELALNENGVHHQTYFFTVVAYNFAGLESDFSNEVTWKSSGLSKINEVPGAPLTEGLK